MLSQCNQYSCYKNKIIDIYAHYHHKKQYTQYNKQQNKKNHKYFEIFNFNDDLIQKKQIIHSYIPSCFLSEIHINHNSIKLLNTYLKNDKQLMFNQISLENSYESKIYNFGIGYRKNYRNNFIIGNNIFYDTTISENEKKILSIGHEFFKKHMHITTNVYYNMMFYNNIFHPINIKNKKYCPHSYDIRIKSKLPFLKKITGKINMEHSFHHKNDHHISSQNTSVKPNYKIILGIDYTPIPMFTFNIDKTIYHSNKTHGTKFNVTVNYKLTTLSRKRITAYNQYINNNKIAIIDKNYTVNRNNNIILNDYNNNNSDITHIYIMQNNSDEIQLINNKNISHKKNTIHQPKNIKQIFKLKENNDLLQFQENYHHSNNNSLKLLAIITTHNINKKQHLNNDNNYLISTTIKPVNLSITNLQHIHITKNDTDLQLIKNKNTTNQKKKHESSKSIIHNNKNIIINHEYANKSHQINTQTNFKNDIKEKNAYRSNKHRTQKIPTPPPLPEPFLIAPIKSGMIQQQQNNQPTINIFDNYNDYPDDQIPKQIIQNINQYKQEKFSSLGSEQHLAKLNNITKKRKKTTSTNSSTSSNNSELATILKIIERQNILTSDSDNTDNDDKISMNSNNNNEFSDN